MVNAAPVDFLPQTVSYCNHWLVVFWLVAPTWYLHEIYPSIYLPIHLYNVYIKNDGIWRYFFQSAQIQGFKAGTSWSKRFWFKVALSINPLVAIASLAASIDPWQLDLDDPPKSHGRETREDMGVSNPKIGVVFTPPNHPICFIGFWNFPWFSPSKNGGFPKKSPYFWVDIHMEQAPNQNGTSPQPFGTSPQPLNHHWKNDGLFLDGDSHPYPYFKKNDRPNTSGKKRKNCPLLCFGVFFVVHPWVFGELSAFFLISCGRFVTGLDTWGVGTFFQI